MKVIVAVLSDIHFSRDSVHPIPKRSDAIANAIASSEARPNAIVLLFCGDIANWGLATEYQVAEAFVGDLRRILGMRFAGVDIVCLSIPGNHDLEHPEGSDDYRRTLVEGAGDCMREPRENLFYLNRLLEPQKNYWDFARAHCPSIGSAHEMICAVYRLKVGEAEIVFNLMNTAILSQRNESQGSLLLPMPLIQGALGRSESLTVTVMHHPTFWIESQILTELRDLLGQCSDYVVTGHEHFSSGYEVKSDLGYNIRYFESPALFDSKKPLQSAFRVLVFDLEDHRERQTIFEWAGSLYKSKLAAQTEFEWRSMAASRMARQQFSMNPATLDFLGDPGFAAPRIAGRNVRLPDIFEYPDLQMRKRMNSKETLVKRAKQVLPFLAEDGLKILHGAPLSGKTFLSRALALDLRGSGTPVWLDGKSMKAKTVDDFEKVVRSAFIQQYSADQFDRYSQLAPSDRSVVIDDWHLAALPRQIRQEIYDWLTHFASVSVLVVDQNFDVVELLSNGKGGEVLGAAEMAGIKRAEISSMGRVGQASLIHRYLRLTRGSLDDLEDGKEMQRLEGLVSQLLGKDRLPAFPFFILCILQAMGENRTDAIAGGSLGPLYEVLIFSALGKDGADDPLNPKKLAFLQEIAFHMWQTRMCVITTSEIQNVTESFTEWNYQTFPAQQFLDSLVKIKILNRVDGSYSFCYPQYYYYFVARYIREHIDDPGAQSLREQVDLMIDEISSVENSTILMVLIYFEKDKNRIIDRLLKNAASIYSGVAPARLEEDAVAFSDLKTPRIDLVIEERPDVAGNRRKLRELNDLHEEKSLGSLKDESESASLVSYSYSDALPDHRKLHLTTQYINALGQVIRNFSVNLPGQRKVQVLKETYLLALRALARVMALCKGIIDRRGEFKGAETGELSAVVMRRMIEEVFTLLPQMYALTICFAISNSVGIADMDRAYIETAEGLGRSVAIKLIDLTVQLNHFSSFPEQLIRDLSVDVRSNPFAAQILEILVVGHFMLHKVDDGTLRRTARLLGMKVKTLTIPD